MIQHDQIQWNVKLNNFIYFIIASIKILYLGKEIQQIESINKFGKKFLLFNKLTLQTLPILCIKNILFLQYLMSKEYTEKIRNLLSQSNQTVPYILQRFYTVLKLITLSINHQNNDPKLYEQYSLIYRTVKRWVVDEPYLLVNNSQKIEKQLKAFLKPLVLYIKDDPLQKKILEYFADKDVCDKITVFFNEAEKVKSQLLAKNIKIKVFGTHEMSNAFWIRKFKNQYAVHVDSFWNKFLEFIEEINFFGYFVSISSKKTIMKKVDCEKKYFVTSMNVSQLFYKLSEPKFLQELADETAKGNKPISFSSKDFLQLKFSSTQGSVFETILKQGQDFQISGEDTLIDGHQMKINHPPTVIFGSSIDSDVKIKNKYVSRKQFMLIEEDEKVLPGSSAHPPFSLVCLSSSNFTMVIYNRSQKLKAGMIFKLGQNSVQVVKISSCTKQKDTSVESEDSENDQTLEYLPVKARQEVLPEKQMQYLCISGPLKGQKGKLTKQNLRFQQQIYEKQSLTIEYRQHQFYLPQGTRILVKTANQVINGELSDKIFVEEGMKIVLEECQFQIV